MTSVKNIRVAIFIILILIAGLTAFGQSDQIGSPYSRYGLGDLYNKGLSYSESMSDVSIGMRSSYNLNLANPASLTAMDSMSFTFEFGISDNIRSISNSSIQNMSSDANFRYLIMGFPITKWWSVAVGIMPFSDVSFNIGYNDTVSDFGGLGDAMYFYRGENGLNQFFISSGFQLTPKLSIGTNINYLFGNIKRSNEVFFPDDIGAWNFEEITNTIISDFTFDFGAQYFGKLKNEWDYTIGLTFNLKNKISAENDFLYQKYLNNSFTTDTIASFSNNDELLELPLGFGLGFSVNNEKIVWGADIKYQNWADIEIFDQNPNLANSVSLASAMEYIPNRRSTKYFKTIRLRTGVKFENSYLNIPLVNEVGIHDGDYEQLKDYSVSVGFGFPVRRTKSTINIGLKLGTRGTTDKNLVKENYAIVSVNLSLHDIWFVKRKFD